MCLLNFIENFKFYGSLCADKSNFCAALDNGWRHSESPRTTGVDTLRRPGQRVLTLRVAPDNGWLSLGVDPDNIGTFYFGVAFVWSLVQKDFWRRPGQWLANTPRRPRRRVVTLCAPGQRALTLCAAPDNGW